MKVIVDTNILFSACLSVGSKERQELILSENPFYAPNFVFPEIFKYKEKILRYSKANEQEIYQTLIALTEKIQFVPNPEVSLASRQKAYDLCKNIDEKDTPFVALTIELAGLLWTGDKKLKNGLIRQNFHQFYQI